MYLVLDLETETHTFHKRKASPFDERNWVVARGWKKQGDAHNSWTYHPTHDRTTYLDIPSNVTMLVGFNLKFDLLWEMAQSNPTLSAFFKRGGKVWDCQYAEYLIMAQQDAAQMAALDSMVEKYGGRKKLDEVKILWEAGVQTSEIQEHLLIDYLVGTEAEGRNSGDIGNTELIFLGQIQQAQKQGQLKMIEDRMDGLLATLWMEFAGLKVDIEEARRRLGELHTEFANVSQDLQQYLPPDLPFEFKWTNQQNSMLIFGGTMKYQAKATYIDPKTGQLARKKAYEQVPIGTYLSGKKKGEVKYQKVEVEGELKTRYEDFFYTFPRITEPEDRWKLATTDGLGNPLWSVSKDQIEELSLRNIPFLKALASKQRLDKEIGTYYLKVKEKSGEVSGMLTCVQTADHILHHKLNHSLTVTTRLSSSDPNLQNLPKAGKSHVKRMFTSRFLNGVMVEADYSQLEVVVQGVLSKDKNLCQSLRDRVDFHCKRVAAKHNITYEEALDWCKNPEHPDFKAGEAERTNCKVFSFQRAYGAGAPKIAYETGIPLADVEAMIIAEELLFPGVVKFNSMVETAVRKSAVPFQKVSDTGEWKTYRRGFWQAPTGTIYSFMSHEALDWQKKKGITDSFMPTELKNYPVQGTGGEFVQGMLGRLWRYLISVDFYDGQVALVNTVHDSVWADCASKEIAEVVARDMIRELSAVPEYYNQRYGMDIDVPFPVDVKMGPNMYDMKHFQ